MKNKEELNALKKEVETLSRKLRELTEDELEQVTGGQMMLTRLLAGTPDPVNFSFIVPTDDTIHNFHIY